MKALDLERTRSPVLDAIPLIHEGWNGRDDPENPFNWSKSRKWRITAVAVFATLTTVMNGTILTVAHEAIDDAFGVSDSLFPHSYWPVAVWTLGGAVSCMVILPLLEDFGVRPGFLWTYLGLIITLIPQAVAPDFGILLLGRFLSGGCVAVLANTAAGVIPNVWQHEAERSIPMSLYPTNYLLGLSIGPIIGAAISEGLSWRWLSYCQLIFYAACFPIYWFFLEENRGAVILLDRIRRNKGADVPSTKPDSRELLQRLRLSIQRPMVMLFTEPVLLAFSIWSALAVGTVYLLTQSTEQVFAGLYGWNAKEAGYLQASVAIGMAIGWSTAFLSKRLYLASAARNTEQPGLPIPEARLYVSVFGSLVGVTGGMFVYAWTAYPSLPWIAPTIGLVMIGAGIVMVVLGAADYVVDAYASYAASAIAALVVCENVVAAFLPFASQSMYTNLGFQWASSVMGFIFLVLSAAPVVLIVWGRQIRARSPLMRESSERRRESMG